MFTGGEEIATDSGLRAWSWCRLRHVGQYATTACTRRRRCYWEIINLPAAICQWLGVGWGVVSEAMSNGSGMRCVRHNCGYSDGVTLGPLGRSGRRPLTTRNSTSRAKKLRHVYFRNDFVNVSVSWTQPATTYCLHTPDNTLYRRIYSGLMQCDILSFYHLSRHFIKMLY